MDHVPDAGCGAADASEPDGKVWLAARMRDFSESAKALHALLAERVLVLDGAMGTMLQQRDLTAADFGGAALEGCNENLVRSRPDVVLDIHRKYFAAGSDIVETDSFGGAPIVLAEYGLAQDAHELNLLAAKLARQAADEFSTSAKPRFVAGSVGPTTTAITVTGGVTFAGLRDAYYVQAKGLVEGGVDLLLVETCQDTRNIKAALLAIQQLSREIGAEIPVIVWHELRHRSGVYDRSHSHAEPTERPVRVLLSKRGSAE